MAGKEISSDQRSLDVDEALHQYGLKLAENGHSVVWKSDNPHHPRNWSATRKIYDIFWVIFLDLFSYITPHLLMKCIILILLFVQIRYLKRRGTFPFQVHRQELSVAVPSCCYSTA